jgi:hypothetical protein
MTPRTGSTAIRRSAGVAVSLTASAVALIGCGGPEEAPPVSAPVLSAPSPSPTLAPRQALLAAVPGELDGPFRFSITDARDTVTGEVDPAAKGLRLDPPRRATTGGTTPPKASVVVLGEQTWLHVDGPTAAPGTGLGGGWFKLDRSLVPDRDLVPEYNGPDVADTAEVFRGATKVTDAGGGRYTGVTDLTGEPTGDALGLDGLRTLGGRAKAIPFTAVVSVDRHLMSVTLKVPAAGGRPGYEYVITYSEYGSAQAISRPPKEDVEPAPPAAYRLLRR